MYLYPILGIAESPTRLIVILWEQGMGNRNRLIGPEA